MSNSMTELGEAASITKAAVDQFDSACAEIKAQADRIRQLEAALTDLLGAVDALPVGTVDPHSVRDARAALPHP